MPEPFDIMILDLGGDETIILKGDEASPQNVANIVVKYRVERLARLDHAPFSAKRIHNEWYYSGKTYCFKRKVGAGPTGLWVFAECPSFDEFIANEKKLGADPEEVEAMTAMCRAGMIQGRFFSADCPEGEPGSAHVCDLTVISSFDFHQVQQRGWKIWG